jgi:predicted acyl esterase
MHRRQFTRLAVAAPLLGCNEELAPFAHAADAAAAIPPGRSSRDVPLPLGPGGAPVALRFEFLRPAGPGPHPLLVVHHGSTGRGDDPSLFARSWFPQPLADAFSAAGWLVAAPQRRGRGGSGGRYEEGLSPSGLASSHAVAACASTRA